MSSSLKISTQTKFYNKRWEYNVETILVLKLNWFWNKDKDRKLRASYFLFWVREKKDYFLVVLLISYLMSLRGMGEHFRLNDNSVTVETFRHCQGALILTSTMFPFCLLLSFEPAVPSHAIHLESIWSARTASVSILPEVGQSIQRAPKVRLPFFWIPLVHSFFVSPRVKCPLAKNFGIIANAPSMSRSMLPRNLE